MIFSLVRFLLKKNTKSIFLKKNENRTETGSNHRFQFGFLEQKPVQTGWLGFNSIFSVWLGFFRFFFSLGSVWFFLFRAYKTKTEPVGFFKILISLIGFFNSSVFSIIFFLFSRFNRFF